MEWKSCWIFPKLLKSLERETGVEPATSSLGSWHSTTELLPLSVGLNYLLQLDQTLVLTCTLYHTLPISHS